MEGSSRPLGDSRVQQPSNYPNQRSSMYQDRSNSIPISGVQGRHDRSHGRENPSRVGGISWKGDKYSRQLQEDPFNPYSSSILHHADRIHPDSDEEDSSDDSYSSNGSGSETAAPNPRSGKSPGSRGTYKTRSTAPSIPVPALPPLDIYRGSSNPSGLSKSKSQQPWVAEPSGSKAKESVRLPAQPSQDTQGRGADTDFVGGSRPSGISRAMSQQPWVGQLAASSDSQSRSGHKEKEGTRALGQPSSNRPDPLGRGADTDFVVGSYRGKAGGGISGYPTDSLSRLGNSEKESARSSGQPSSSRPNRRDRGADTDFVVGSYRGEPGGGISGHPSDSQSRLGPEENESARLSMQPSSRRLDAQDRGADTDFVVGSGILGHPSDSQSCSGNKEKENPRLLGEPSSSRQEPQVRETDVDYGTVGQGSVGGYRGEASGGASGQPRPWTGKPAPALAPSSMQQPSGRQPEYTSSRPPPNPTTSIPRRQEDSPSYNTRGSGWGGSQPADPSRTTPYGAFPHTQTPQYVAQYSHPSQTQGSLGSQRPGNTWDGGSSRPSGGRDSSSNPSTGATGSYPWGGQPTGAPPGKSTHPPHRVYFPSISASKILTTIHREIDRCPAHESNPSSLTVFFVFLASFHLFLNIFLKELPILATGLSTQLGWWRGGYRSVNMAIFFGLWLKTILLEAQSFTTTSTHPSMQRGLPVRVFLFMITTSR